MKVVEKNKVHLSGTISTIVTPLISMLEHLNEPWGLKTADSRHIYMNSAAMDYTQTPSNFEFEGRYDEEFPASWAESAAELKKHDRLTEQSRAQVAVIETDYWYGRSYLTPFISEKMPVYNSSGGLDCIIWNAKPMTSLSPLKYISTHTPSILTVNINKPMFTQSEYDIIFLLLQRYSEKEIAKVYNLSVRTISHRVQEIYSKADVHSRRQFEEYCRLNGLDNYIPSRLLIKGIRYL